MEEVMKMSTEELCQWLKTRLENEDGKDDEIVLRQQHIKGANFLNYT